MKHLFRHLLKKLLPLFPLGLRRNLLFLWRQGGLLHAKPRTFSEKVQWRILHDRRKLIATGGDKLSMKLHAESTGAQVIIPETLWSGEDLESIYDLDWNCRWVLKPIAGSGYALFGSGSLSSSNVNLKEIAEWRHDDSYRVYGEWAYGQARKGYLLERRIETETGASPNDIRFFVFDGKVRIIQVDSPRVHDVRRRFYTSTWEPLPYRQAGKELAEVQPAPELLQEMIVAAEKIGRAYDFIRVDLYEALGKLYFGEITPYPTGGLGKYDDKAFDLLLGNYWKLPASAPTDS